MNNKLRVFENDVKGSTASSSSTQNIAFVSENTSSTNDVSIAYNVSTPSGQNSQTKGNQDSRRRDAWNSGNKDGRRSGQQEDSKALVTIDGEESYAKLKKLYDAQREQLSDANIEIKAYTQGLKKVEAQLVAHQQGQLWYEEKIRFMKIDLDDKTDVLTYHKKLLAEAQKEKEDLKAKVEKWHNSSKNLGKLLNTQMSANDKFGLGYGDHRYDGILSYENEVLQSVFMNKESELEKQPLYDRFVTAGGMHAVPPPMTGNYMPSRPDVEIDYSQFTYGPKQSQPSESETQTSDFDTCESECSVQTHESLPEPTVIEPKVVDQPKVWSDAPIIEEYESDSEDEHVSQHTKRKEQPSFASTNKQVKTPRETVQNQFTHSKNPRVDKKGLGYGFTARACFVCGSLSHLIRDCDFHEKRMAKQAELNNSMRKKSSQREIRPIWNNVQRVNNKNQFVPTAVLTRTGKIPVNTARASGTNKVSTARHDFNRQAVLTSAAMKVNTVKPIVNRVRPTTVFHKTHSPFSRPFNNTTTLRTNFSKQKVNTAKVNAVSAVGGKRETAVKPSAGCNWRPQSHHIWHNDYPHRALQNKGIVDSGCSRHMTGNKAYLAEYQDFNGGPVAFGGSKGYITGKGKIKTGKLDFEDVCFVKELQHFNLFSVSQMCDKKNKLLFTDSKCLVLSHEFKLPDENQVLLRIPRQNNMYSFNLENIVPSGGLATSDDSTFDDLDADHVLDYMDTEEPVNEGRLSKETKELNVTHDTEVLEKGGINEEPVSVVGNTGVSTAVPEVSTATPMTPPTTTSVFEDEDIFLADALVMLSDKTKLKGVAIKEVKESDRPERSILTLKPLPSIDPKDKGKGVLKESPVKKVKRSDLDAAQIAKDAEVARLVYEEELAELEKEKEERQRQEQASMDYIANLYDKVQAKMDASEELAARLQMEEREMYTVEERSRYKHAQLNKKTLEEIQALYFKEQERAADFVPIGSEKDERMIEKMNKKASGVDKEEVLEEPDNFDLEEEEQLKAFLMIVPDEEGEINYEFLDKRFPIVDWESKFYHTDRYGKPHDYYRVFRADGIHILVLEDGTEFYMLAERRYPLIKETLKRMLALRLIAESESEAIFDLLRFIQKQIDESGSHDGNIKNWLVQSKRPFGKDFSNPFTADSLLKTIWFSTHHASHAPCYSNEALAIPEQTATGKEISNPFMAGEDCWVLEDFTTYCCWFNIGAASEDLVLLRKIEENRLSL
ncbi:hypothetical protein Tco_1033008 [Tanacetum coccineum]|uniref:Retrovirus-related Pol polyprotein from transposon TNT 1-94-like beta-barrel domain-containing protein n=1 Tax=Tanacetum coccineum TaxID=301880 RepID=A0ABQ5GFJ0_9ASTR